jgi:hypothetical protein
VTAQQAPALPECSLCERPTRRATWEANGGLCSDCLVGAVLLRTPRTTRRAR